MSLEQEECTHPAVFLQRAPRPRPTRPDPTRFASAEPHATAGCHETLLPAGPDSTAAAAAADVIACPRHGPRRTWYRSSADHPEQAQPLVAPTSAMRGVRGAAATRKTDAAVAATTPTAAATLSDAHAFDHRVPTVHSSEAEELFCCCSWSNQWARLRPCIARSPTPWWRHEPCGFRSCSERLARRMHSHSQSPGPESVPSRHWGSTPHWVGLRARRFNASAGLYTPSVSSGASNYARSDFDCHSCVLTATYLL